MYLKVAPNGLVIVELTLLNYMLYKKYNLISLLKDLTNTRQNKLSRGDIISIVLMAILILMTQIYLNVIYGPLVSKYFNNIDLAGAITFKSDNKFLLGISLFLLHVVYVNTVWWLLLSTSFLIGMISIILSREFQTCASFLQNEIKENGSVSLNAFTTATERFNDLAQVTYKVDNLFSTLVGMSVVASTGNLCSTVYYSLSETASLEEQILMLLISTVSMINLFVPLADLNSKV